jgi:hypothetical protein
MVQAQLTTNTTLQTMDNRQRTTDNSPLISLIVVTYNSADLLPAFFAALAMTTYARYEVLVVDNASHDGTALRASVLWPGVQVLANKENVGFGRACNQGARAARGEFVVFLNPDVTATPDWLTILAQHAAEYPDAAILCPTTLWPGQLQQPALQPVEETAAAPGCAIMMRRTMWHELGGFDEQIFLYWEDTELCWRAWLCGWRVLADLQAYVYHERGGSAGNQRWDAEQTKNSLYTYLKLMRWRRVVPFVLLLVLKTLGKIALGRGRGLMGAWAWNLTNLGGTFARRREMMRRRKGDPAMVERRILAHERRQRRERIERQYMMISDATRVAEGIRD